MPQENIDRILVRSTNWIGDGIMTSPAVRTIRENYPKAHIAMLVHPWLSDVFSASPYIDEVISYHKKGIHRGIGGMLKLSRELADRKFDMAILLQGAFEAAFITWLAQIPVRCGYSKDGRRLFLTHPVKISDQRKSIHQVHYYQKMLADLGLTPGSDELFLQLPADALKMAEMFFSTIGKGPVVGLNPGAAYGPAKRWPAELFAQLASKLSQEDGAQLVIFGTEADKLAAKEIVAAAPDNVHDLTGKTNLAEAMAVIGKCHCFVTNDSGLMHVGAALKTPLVALFGSTNSVTTGPFSDNAVILNKNLPCSPCMKTHCETDFRCMYEITPDEVAGAVRGMLKC